jgi:glycerol-3-phosphate dehydrogenase (NAD+)
MLRLCGFRSGSYLRNLQLSRFYRSNYSTLNTTTGKMAFLGGHEKKHKVTIVGSGNWYVRYVNVNGNININTIASPKNI